MKLQIPTKKDLGYGYIIQIKQLSKHEYLDVLGEDEPTADSLWVVGRRTIYLQKQRSSKAKMLDYLHELDHAHHDWEHWVCQELSLYST